METINRVTMTAEDFKALVESRPIAVVRDTLIDLVQAWRPYRRIRLLLWPDYARYSAWMEYDDQLDLNGHASVQGVRGEGKDADAAIRDCAVKWFTYIRESDAAREKRIGEIYRSLDSRRC